jgi:hypothetical protein
MTPRHGWINLMSGEWLWNLFGTYKGFIFFTLQDFGVVAAKYAINI